MDKNNPSDIVVLIPPSTSTNGIANILYEKGLIRHPLIFKYEVRKGMLIAGLKQVNIIYQQEWT